MLLHSHLFSSLLLLLLLPCSLCLPLPLPLFFFNSQPQHLFLSTQLLLLLLSLQLQLLHILLLPSPALLQHLSKPLSSLVPLSCQLGNLFPRTSELFIQFVELFFGLQNFLLEIGQPNGSLEGIGILFHFLRLLYPQLLISGLPTDLFDTLVELSDHSLQQCLLLVELMAQHYGQVLPLAVIADKCFEGGFAFCFGVGTDTVAALRAAAPRTEHTLHLLPLATELVEAEHTTLPFVLGCMLELLLRRYPVEDLAAVVDLRPFFDAELVVDCLQSRLVVDGISQVQLVLADPLCDSLQSLPDNYS